MNINAQVLSFFCKAFLKRIHVLKVYQTIIDTGINQTNRESKTSSWNLYWVKLYENIVYFLYY